jgi:hypothetical protein
VTQITNDHVEWAVVDRLRLMLEEPPHIKFNVTQTFALFTSILCWVIQRIRVRKREIDTEADHAASRLWELLKAEPVSMTPWSVPESAAPRAVHLGRQSIQIPPPSGFEGRNAGQFLVNLRNAVAHGDARNVSPFNVPNGSERLLTGFTFRCSERSRTDPREITWRGEITLIEDDLRRIGVELAKRYCDALRSSDAHHADGNFASDADRSVQEVAT